VTATRTVRLASASASASLLASLLAPVLLATACGTEKADVPSLGDAGNLSDAARRDGAADGGAEAGPKGHCETYLAYTQGCGETPNCGDKFLAWCASTEPTESAQLHAARIQCMNAGNCKAKDRHACEYETYAAASLSAAQRALAEAYCSTCEAGDVAGCVARSTTYDAAKGPDGVTDIFLGVYESSDALATEMKNKCTGAALGFDAGTCARAFAVCAGGVFVDALPNCPK
jgi:hypothetical protein